MKKRLAIFYPAARSDWQGDITDITEAKNILSESYDLVNLVSSPEGLKEKREEFMSLVSDQTIDFLLCWYGGRVEDDGNLSRSSYELVSLLTPEDWQIIERRKPVIIGRSDLTYLQSALLNHGICSYYGPCLLSGLSKKTISEQIHSEEEVISKHIHLMIDAMNRALGESSTTIDFGSPILCEGDFPIVAVPGKAMGRLIGGNLDTISTAFRKGYNSAIPKREPGDIIFLEENDANYWGTWKDNLGGDCFVEGKLKLLKEKGFFDDISGLIFGRNASPKWHAFEDYKGREANYIKEVILPALGISGIPILLNVACGHKSPTTTIPIGKVVTLDTDTQQLTCSPEYSKA